MPGHTLPPRARVEEYEIQRTLGQGGFGITYLAWDHTLAGAVALKEYFPGSYAVRGRGGTVEPASAETRANFRWGFDRFLTEARTIHKLSHDNVVHVRRHFKARGTAYLAMEYVEGDSLEEILRERGTLTPDEWRPLLDRVLDGLEHVHGHHYLHRDIKPGNIVIRDRDGAPVLIDFGAAREKTPDGQYTAVMTPAYAPVEQNGSGKQTPATDLFSLGAVSYEVLMGELPPSAFDRVAVTDDPIPKLAQRITGADRTWLAALDRCLAVRPADRPKSVKELREHFRSRSGSVATPVAVREYRARFVPALSGNGKVHTTTLYEGGSRWEVRRWVGRRTSGALMATVFAPARRGLSDGEPLFSRVFNNLDDAYTWLYGLDESDAIQKAAEERLESLAPARPTPKPSPPPRPQPPPPGPQPPPRRPEPPPRRPEPPPRRPEPPPRRRQPPPRRPESPRSRPKSPPPEIRPTPHPSRPAVSTASIEALVRSAKPDAREKTGRATGDRKPTAASESKQPERPLRGFTKFILGVWYFGPFLPLWSAFWRVNEVEAFFFSFVCFFVASVAVFVFSVCDAWGSGKWLAPIPWAALVLAVAIGLAIFQGRGETWAGVLIVLCWGGGGWGLAVLDRRFHGSDSAAPSS